MDLIQAANKQKRATPIVFFAALFAGIFFSALFFSSASLLSKPLPDTTDVVFYVLLNGFTLSLVCFFCWKLYGEQMTAFTRSGLERRGLGRKHILYDEIEKIVIHEFNGRPLKLNVQSRNGRELSIGLLFYGSTHDVVNVLRANTSSNVIWERIRL